MPDFSEFDIAFRPDPASPFGVPGHVISKEVFYFLAQLDVTEIHGYNQDLGLLVYTEGALKRLTADRPEQPERLGSTADRSPGFGSRA